MPHFLKYLSLCLAVIAVGAAQVFGAQVSYFCNCTGQRTVLESCADSGCHAQDQAHAGAPARAGNHQSSGNTLPADPRHQHEEILEKFLGTHTPPPVSTPVVIWVVVLADPSLCLGTYQADVQWPSVSCTGPPEYGSPPMPQMVARVMVMLV